MAPDPLHERSHVRITTMTKHRGLGAHCTFCDDVRGTLPSAQANSRSHRALNGNRRPLCTLLYTPALPVTS